MNRPRQLIKAIALTALGAVVIGLIYALAGAMDHTVILGLVLGVFSVVGADILLYIATKNPKGWIKFYVMRVSVILVAVLLAVFIPIFSPVTTVLTLIISLPAIAVVGIVGRKGDGS